MKRQKTRIAKPMLKKKSKEDGHHSQARLTMKLTQCGTGERINEDQWNKIDGPEMDPCKYNHLMFDKRIKTMK